MKQLKKISYGFAASHSEEEHTSKSYLQINNCGLLAVGLTDDKKSIQKRTPRKDHMLVYFTEQGGYFEMDGKVHELFCGDLVYVEPGIPICFGVKSNSKHYWLHFTGESAAEIMKSAGIPKTGVYHIGYSKSISNYFNDISFSLFPRTPNNILKCNGILLQLLGHTVKRYNNENNDTNEKLTPALKFINTNYFERHSLDFYAKLCDMSLSAFKHSFSKVTNISPLTYINTVRMENAKRYLHSTGMTISEIAIAVGFEDPLYFSKSFKKYTGISPSKYRK